MVPSTAAQWSEAVAKAEPAQHELGSTASALDSADLREWFKAKHEFREAAYRMLSKTTLEVSSPLLTTQDVVSTSQSGLAWLSNPRPVP